MQIETNLTNRDPWRSRQRRVEGLLNGREFRLPSLLHVTRVQPHHAAALVRPTREHVMHPGDAFDVNVRKQQQVDPSFFATNHRRFTIAIERRLVEVSVGVDEKHVSAKIGGGLPLVRDL